MATEFFATLNIDIETDRDVDPKSDQFKKFKKEYEKMLETWDMMLGDLASDNGFEIESIWSIIESDKLQPIEYL